MTQRRSHHTHDHRHDHAHGHRHDGHDGFARLRLAFVLTAGFITVFCGIETPDPDALKAMIRKARAAKMPLLSGPGRKFVLSFSPPMAVGALLTFVLYRAGMIDLIPGVWLLLYGTAVVAGGAFIATPYANSTNSVTPATAAVAI
mgnify:CR=1 FL=1